MTSIALRPGGGCDGSRAGVTVETAVAWVWVGGGPNCALSFAARSFAVTMSALMAVEIAVVTKLTTENRTMTTAKQTDTATSVRKVGLASNAFKLSAVTGLSVAARADRKSTRLNSSHAKI